MTRRENDTDAKLSKLCLEATSSNDVVSRKTLRELSKIATEISGTIKSVEDMREIVDEVREKCGRNKSKRF